MNSVALAARMGFALLVLAAATSASAQSPNYFPCKLGSEWKFDSNPGEFKEAITYHITKVTPGIKSTDVVRTYYVDSRTDKLHSTIYRVTPTEVLEVSYSDDINNPPVPILRYPLKAGQRWTYKGTIVIKGKMQPEHYDFDVSGPIRVQTPDGTFQAMKVRRRWYVNPNYTMTTDYFYAAGIGMVQDDDHKLISHKLK